MKATPLITDQLWILEEGGVEIGSLMKSSDGCTLVRKADQTKEKFSDEVEAAQKLNLSFVTTGRPVADSMEIYDFPVDSSPFNDMYNVVMNLPVYTKEEKSKSYYCAGYYLVLMNGEYERMFCPKMLILSRYEFIGPFKTEEDMMEYEQAELC